MNGLLHLGHAFSLSKVGKPVVIASPAGGKPLQGQDRRILRRHTSVGGLLSLQGVPSSFPLLTCSRERETLDCIEMGEGRDARMSERFVGLQLEFACAYHRLTGKRVLFPQGFHCTGMPIKVRNCVGYST